MTATKILRPQRKHSTTVYNFEIARAFATLRRAPEHRRFECRELLLRQAFLLIQLRELRGMVGTKSKAKPLESCLQIVRNMVCEVTGTEPPAKTNCTVTVLRRDRLADVTK